MTAVERVPRFSTRMLLVAMIVAIPCACCCFSPETAEPAYDVAFHAVPSGDLSRIVELGPSGSVLFEAEAEEGDCFFMKTDGQIIHLGTLGGEECYPIDINRDDVTVGVSTTTDNERRAFVWDELHGMRSLGTLGGPSSLAMSVNDAGAVVGWSNVDADGEARHAFLWTDRAGMRDLGAFKGWWTEAGLITETGRIFGRAIKPHAGHVAFVWTDAEGMVPIGEAPSIEVVQDCVGGLDLVVNAAERIFVWDGTQELRPLDCDSDSKTSCALDANGVGEIVGFSKTRAQRTRQATRWTVGGRLEQLTGVGLRGGTEYMALGINDAGVIVGWTGLPTPYIIGPGQAWVWDRQQGMRLLQDLLAGVDTGFRLVAAEDVDDAGKIVGVAEGPDGRGYLFVATPRQERLR